MDKIKHYVSCSEANNVLTCEYIKESHKMYDRSKFQKLEFGEYIWIHQEKCIQISTNMPSIGSLYL